MQIKVGSEGTVCYQSGKNKRPKLGETLKKTFSPGRGIIIWLINYE